MKVLFVNDSTSNPNWGDRAAAMALEEMLVEAGHEIVARITEDDLRDGTAFELPPRMTALPSADAPLTEIFRAKLRRKLERRSIPRSVVPGEASEFEPRMREFERDHVRFGALQHSIESCDAVVIHGDGAMAGPSTNARSQLFLAYVAKRAFGRPVLLVNHTADLEHPRLRAMADLVYPLLDDVVYRDEMSAERWSSSWPGRYAPDSAFRFRASSPEAWAAVCGREGAYDVWPDRAHFDPTRPYVCLGGSSIFSFDGHPQKIIDGCVALAEHLCDRGREQVVLTASDSKDELVFREVARWTRLPLVGLHCPVPLAVDLLANARAYVGGRWHPSIFALAHGTPVVPLASKTFKMQALVRMAGLGETTYDIDDAFDVRGGVATTLNERIAAGEALRAELRAWGAQQHLHAAENVSGLTALEGHRGGTTRNVPPPNPVP